MKVCKKCGKNNKKNAKKCEFCGFLFENEENLVANQQDFVDGKEVPVNVLADKPALDESQNASADEKPQTAVQKKVGIIYRNVKYWLGFWPVLFMLAALIAVCVLGIVYFDGRRGLYAVGEELYNSCTILLAVFCFFLCICAIAFIMSLIFNILKIKRRIKK